MWGTPIYDRSGAVEFTIAAFADISDRRAAERALADQASLLDLAHDAILVWDADQVITFWNRGAERTYGFSRDEAVGQNVTELLHTEYPGPQADREAELDATGNLAGRDGADPEGRTTHRAGQPVGRPAVTRTAPGPPPWRSTGTSPPRRTPNVTRAA